MKTIPMTASLISHKAISIYYQIPLPQLTRSAFSSIVASHMSNLGIHPKNSAEALEMPGKHS